MELADYLEYYAEDPDTAVSLAYLEGVEDGRRFLQVARAHTRRKPLVVVQGGVTGGGKQAAASHTGALASDERIFAGVCRQAGITRAATVEEAYDTAASFARQPLPRGSRQLVVSVAGGGGGGQTIFDAEAGVERMVGFHESQDQRYAQAAAGASERHAKPILVASDLVYTDRAYGNPGPLGVKESGRLPFPSGHRAVVALAHMLRYSRYRQRLESV